MVDIHLFPDTRISLITSTCHTVTYHPGDCQTGIPDEVGLIVVINRNAMLVASLAQG
jgi:hypothetical protein